MSGSPDQRGAGTKIKILCAFGTRPEVIKFLPVLRELESRSEIALSSVLTSQHTGLVRPLIDLWDIRIDHDLEAMVPGQSLNQLMARLVGRMDEVLEVEAPDIVLVQGDTTTALAATQAAWHRQIAVGHIEAGLRSGNRETPFPEEMNRRLISAMATLHFAPTRANARALSDEGIAKRAIEVTGNPIVDAIGLIRKRQTPGVIVKRVLDQAAGQRAILLTTHRREAFGDVMVERLWTLRRFVETRKDMCLLFPVHANPAVSDVAQRVLGDVDRVHLLPPLKYPDFLHVMAASWLVVSDSGGVQEEAPSLGKPLLIIRDTTERAEVLETGVARLVGDARGALHEALVEAERPGSWVSAVGPTENPFGRGDSAARIARAILNWVEGGADMASATRHSLEPAE